jgi:hypothetical protein
LLDYDRFLRFFSSVGFWQVSMSSEYHQC